MNAPFDGFDRDIEGLRDLHDQLLSPEGVDVSDFPADLSEILGANEGNSQLKAVIGNASLRAAGGKLVMGTPWKEDSVDQILRVYYSYEQYGGFENNLIQQIQESHKHIAYDAIVTLPTGGINLGLKASRILGKSLHYAHISSYDAEGNKGDIRMEFMDEFLAGLPPPPARILLIDDLSDSGDSLNFMKKFLEDRGYTVETAAIFEKQGTVHKPSFCVFRDFPKLWIVQPSEMREGSVAGHNVHDMRHHPISNRIYAISEQIHRLIENNNSINTLNIEVPSTLSSGDARVLMEVIKTQVKYCGLQLQFSSLRGGTVRTGRTQDDISLEVVGNVLSIHLPVIPQIYREASRILDGIYEKFPQVLQFIDKIVVYADGYERGEQISLGMHDTKMAEIIGLGESNNSNRGMEWTFSAADKILYIFPFLQTK